MTLLLPAKLTQASTDPELLVILRGFLDAKMQKCNNDVLVLRGSEYMWGSLYVYVERYHT